MLLEYCICLVVPVTTLMKTFAGEVCVPHYSPVMDVHMNRDIRIIYVHIRPYTIILLLYMIADCIFHLQCCIVAVSDPAACLGGACNLDCSFRVDPVLPGKGKRRLIELLVAFCIFIYIKSHKQPRSNA